MFDLFKKEEINSLKSRISQLEEENKILKLQFEKKEEKAKIAIALKQEVDRELNEARNKISSLTNEIQNLKTGKTEEIEFRFSEKLSKNRIQEIIYSLESFHSSISTLITLYLEKDQRPPDIAQDVIHLIDPYAIHLIEKIDSNTGKIIFYDTNHLVNILIVPVFPVIRSNYDLGVRFGLQQFKKNLEYEKILAVNAHAGETIIGIVENDAFSEHKIIRTSVMGKHKHGGWSQKRFQILVEEDIKHHADKVRFELESMIIKHEDLQCILAGGEGKLIKMILEGLDYPVILKTMDTASDGNIDQMLRDILAVRCYWI